MVAHQLADLADTALRTSVFDSRKGLRTPVAVLVTVAQSPRETPSRGVFRSFGLAGENAKTRFSLVSSSSPPVSRTSSRATEQPTAPNSGDVINCGFGLANTLKLHCGKLTLKIYTTGERVLRIEVVVP